MILEAWTALTRRMRPVFVTNGGIGAASASAVCPQMLHRLRSRPDGIGDEPEVDERRQVAIAVWNDRRGGRVSDHRDLEALLEQVPQMGLDAKVGGHAREDDLVDAVLAELQRKVVLLRTVDLVR